MSEYQSSTSIDPETARKAKRAAYNKARNAMPEQQEKNRASCRTWYKANQSEEQRKARERARAVTKELKKARRDKARSTPEAKAKHAAESRAYYAANKERVRAREKARHHARKTVDGPYWIARKYGLKPEDIRTMIKGQNNRCPCCKTEFGLFKAHQPFVDHCHATGRVRGILCNKCNALLGHANDNPAILRAAARYLERFAKQDPAGLADLK